MYPEETVFASLTFTACTSLSRRVTETHCRDTLSFSTRISCWSDAIPRTRTLGLSRIRPLESAMRTAGTAGLIDPLLHKWDLGPISRHGSQVGDRKLRLIEPHPSLEALFEGLGGVDRKWRLR